ncbi:hypothetical protein PSHT_12560 [Puccinia striiformis]|uniref:Uncharacterized protein n=1 Tax=Puccinia striiformis TaxID=27350 RepID=A0A2S4UW36_9BASI|nr:hypothetical protein PSHT_12560 [Puccinia striiformis]
MTANPSSLQNGSMPTTVTNLRSQLCASGIPDGNSAFARSIHDFTRVVLGVEAANSDVPPSPPNHNWRLLRLHQTRHLLVVLFLPASVHTSPNTIFQASKLEGESIVSLSFVASFRARYGPR